MSMSPTKLHTGNVGKRRNIASLVEGLQREEDLIVFHGRQTDFHSEVYRQHACLRRSFWRSLQWVVTPDGELIRRMAGVEQRVIVQSGKHRAPAQLVKRSYRKSEKQMSYRTLSNRKDSTVASFKVYE